ncbi:hypothetical protein ACIA8G_35180 [Lentzea sp. NPDC051213]|uniref:hypothetical protein n=1 Tax=Lentzea sp. NPDC051213 TaxID=3364126 RepID=UPI00379A9699
MLTKLARPARDLTSPNPPWVRLGTLISLVVFELALLWSGLTVKESLIVVASVCMIAALTSVVIGSGKGGGMLRKVATGVTAAVHADEVKS